MRVLLSTCGSRGDVEPMVGLAVQLRALGAEVPECAPPDFAELLARFGVPLVPAGQPVRPLAAQFDTVVAAAEECDAPVATGVMPAGVRL
jgi:vancomycin aglycone glucosyltransferase